MLYLLAMTALSMAPQDSPSGPPSAFRNIASEAGLGAAPAGRPQLVDVDADGWLDLVAGGPVRHPEALRIFLSRPAEGGGRTFVDASAAIGLDRELDGKSARAASFLVWGDLDADGDLDAVSIATQTAEEYAAHPRSHRVYLNDGKGRFHPLAEDGLELPHHRATHGAALCDLDLDGRLDLACGNSYVAYGKSLVAQPMRVYRGDGKGAFEEVTAAWGLATSDTPGAPDGSRPLYGLSAADLDGDGYPELLGAAYGRQWNTAWMRTSARPRYRDRAAELGIDGDAIRHGRYSPAVKEFFRKRYGSARADEKPFRSNGNTFSLVPADFDGDGDTDLFCAAITHSWAGESSDLSTLLVNRLAEDGKLSFHRCLEHLEKSDPQTLLRWRPTRGLARDHRPQDPHSWNQGDLQAHWGDLDNDGLLDLLVCESDYPHNHLRVFLQRPAHDFVESEQALGLIWPNCAGLALGDFDRDGDLDLATNGTRTRWPAARPADALALWRNDAPPANGFLCLRLIGDGTHANRSAIGAVAILETSAGTQTRQLLGPYGHWGAQLQPGELHFGLGRASPRKLTIRWPDAARTTTNLEHLPRKAWIVLRQGDAGARVMERFDQRAWSR